MLFCYICCCYFSLNISPQLFFSKCCFNFVYSLYYFSILALYNPIGPDDRILCRINPCFYYFWFNTNIFRNVHICATVTIKILVYNTRLQD